jgi:hypothetical protein
MRRNLASALLKARRLTLESLEERHYLAANPIITEFMAANDGTLLDGNGKASDWIELYNAGDAPIDLAGWHLTDSPDNLDRWTFPSKTLNAGDYLVVFASGDDATDPAGNLHTDFNLRAEGEYLALVAPDGLTIASQFGVPPATFPPQYENVSFGRPAQVDTTVYVGEHSAGQYLIPTSGDNTLIGPAWRQPGFIPGAAGESPWTTGNGGFGYTSYANDALIGADLETPMLNHNASAYVRLPFTVGSADELAALHDLNLGMKYDDGFVAYLNGTEIARRNAPASVAWNSAATADAGATHIAYPTFASTSGMNLLGAAEQFGDRIRLTPSADSLAGGAFLTDKVALAADLTFSTHFTFEISQSDDHPGDADGPGADGFMFAIHNDPRGASALGERGAGLGLANENGTMNVQPVVAVEFDTYFGGAWDVANNNPNHIGIDTSTSNVSVAQTGQLPKWLDAGPQYAWVDYVGATDTMNIYLATTDVKPASPVLTKVIDLNSIFGTASQLYFGFTAGTGGASENHDIRSWTLDAPAGADAPVTPPPTATNLTYANFTSTADFTLNGSAAKATDRIRLTPTLTSQAGSAFRTQKVTLPANYSFSTNFAFQMSGAGPAGISDPDGIGADGMAFVMHRDARGPTALGNLGCGLGFTNCNNTNNIQPYVAVELDTWHTGALDPPANTNTNGNHLGIDASTSQVTLFQSGALPRFNNGTPQYVWIDYDGATKVMNVYLNQSANVKPAAPTLTGTIDLASIFGGLTDVYFGFTGGTGGAYQNQDVLGWQLAADAPVAPPQPTGVQRFADEQIDVSAFKNLLQVGSNVLAIQGLNASAGNSDFLVAPTLVGRTAGSYQPAAERYFLTPTPGSTNGTGQSDLGPIISDVSHGGVRPTDGQNIVVTAGITPTSGPVDGVTLHYRVMYGIEATLPMRDDGTLGDVTAGDGIYSATIPAAASAPGELVRYYVTATALGGGASRAPLYEDHEGEYQSPEYFGTVIADPAVASALPTLEWFLAPGTQAGAETDAGTRGSVFYDGTYYDNIFVRRRGDASSSAYPKANFKFKFNNGYDFTYRADEDPVSEFNLNGTWSDKAYIRQVLAWETYRDSGSPYSLSFPMRIEQNGSFFSVAMFVEQPDQDYFERQDLPEGGALYKMRTQLESVGGGTEKDTRLDEDFSDLQALVNGISPSNPNRSSYVFDNVDLPRMFDYLAASVIMHENDQMSKNYYMYRDRPVSEGGTGEWFMLPWDKDLTFGKNWEPTAGGVLNDLVWADNDQIPGKSPLVKPSHPLFGDSQHQKNDLLWNRLIDAIYQNPTLKAMYLRRLRTLMDKILQPNSTPAADRVLDNRIDELVAQMAPDVALDRAKWGNPYGTSYDFVTATNIIKNDYLVRRRNHLYVTHSIHNTTGAGTTDVAGIPDAQAAAPTITFGAIDFNPASGNQDQEYIELVNPNATAVDLSGWKITGGIEHTFREGTIIPAGGKLYVTPSAGAFRARTTGPRGGQSLLVQDGYSGHLSNFGETLTLSTASDTTVATTTTPSMPSANQQYLRITEIMYHPVDPSAAEIAAGFVDGDQFEFVELQNTSATTTLDLDEVRFTNGVSNVFGARSLAPGEYVVVVANADAFHARYGSAPTIAGTFVGNLSNGGDHLTLDDQDGSTIHDFDYDDADPWPTAADGAGYSLVIVNPVGALATWAEPTAWRASQSVGGSPGAADHLTGDLNGDNRVDIGDLAILQSNLGTTSGAAYAQGDLNGDGAVNRQDAARLAQNFGASISPPQSPAAIVSRRISPAPTIVATPLAALPAAQTLRAVRRSAGSIRSAAASDQALSDLASESPMSVRRVRDLARRS